MDYVVWRKATFQGESVTVMSTGAIGGTPANAYVAEDGTTFYVAEDGTTFYVQEV